MFAYLLIVIELAILYSVFWYVFVREPKPFNVAADMWGTYDYSRSEFTKYDASSEAKRAETNPELLRGFQSAVTLASAKTRSQCRFPMKPIHSTLKYGWVVKDQKPEPTAVEKLFSRFRNTLELLTAKAN